jgi:8-oxo-dGTP pyrophosphatase MutT (NUDIX family)
MSYRFDAGLRDRMVNRLAAFERRVLTDPELRPAAVVIVVVPGETENGQRLDDGAVLLTRRAKTLRRHAGQYALPGGRMDPGETVVQAALRELDEELRVTLDPSHVLGLLDDMPTRSGFRVTPVVAWAEGVVAINPDPVEVARVFRIPLAELDDPALPTLQPTDDGEPVLSLDLKTLGHPLYAPTAALLYQFREVVLGGRDTRVAHYGHPRFAWR